ncbi:DUF4231 domain-containing protein [Bacillus sp. FJAT-50079]|uniref:DUF4231 domain-containing protein n=1 Tax=Bacillus sp. FJAT-50079 TaxID=2833577 RepID=UPI001BC96478|nr:DUF4231 domain-containing protein [Bacillus sp. FJAT-50079]MBS4207050.1 DUF4231 domain-containing protein [Bacillus sp. FJAT-50079]
MNIEKATYLQKEIRGNIQFFRYRKNRHKKRAFHLNLVTVICSATITTLLGLQDFSVGSWFINISIILGAIVTVLNFINGFYNYKELWIKDGKAFIELQELERDLTFYMEGRDPASFAAEELEKYRIRLNEIIHSSADIWYKLHQKEIDKGDEEER